MSTDARELDVDRAIRVAENAGAATVDREWGASVLRGAEELRRLAALRSPAERGEGEDPTAWLAEENHRLHLAGDALAVAALRVTTEYDGVHRLRLAVATWSKATADEGGRAASPPAPVEGTREPDAWLIEYHNEDGSWSRSGVYGFDPKIVNGAAMPVRIVPLYRAALPVQGERWHQGDPCVHCGTPHDEVLIGDCRGREIDAEVKAEAEYQLHEDLCEYSRDRIDYPIPQAPIILEDRKEGSCH